MKSNIISADVYNNLTEFTFSISQHFCKFAKMLGALAPSKQWTMAADVSIFMFRTIESPITRALSSGFSVGASLSWENLFDVLIGMEEQCSTMPTMPHCHSVALLHGPIRNRTMYMAH